MNYRRGWLFVWVCISFFWITAAVMIHSNTWVQFSSQWQAVYPLRADLEPWKPEWKFKDPSARPLYEIIRSASQEKLPLKFEYLGWQGGSKWNQYLNGQPWTRYPLVDTSTLYLNQQLTREDKSYYLDEFWAQRWTRWEASLKPLAGWALIPPFFLLLGLGLAYRNADRALPQRPPLARPMQWLRIVVLLFTGVQLLQWIAEIASWFTLIPGGWNPPTYAVFSAAAFVLAVMGRWIVAAAVLAILSLTLGWIFYFMEQAGLG
jgi:hypothetical protein